MFDICRSILWFRGWLSDFTSDVTISLNINELVFDWRNTMKIKSLLLGSAAAMIAVSGAQAADAIIVEAEPMEYVKVCDMYGNGFFYIPGTEICMNINGYVRSTYRHSERNIKPTSTALSCNIAAAVLVLQLALTPSVDLFSGHTCSGAYTQVILSDSTLWQTENQHIRLDCSWSFEL